MEYIASFRCKSVKIGVSTQRKGPVMQNVTKLHGGEAPKPRKRAALNLKTTDEMRAALDEAAAASGRSLAAEVELRLTQSLDDQDAWGGADMEAYFRLCAAKVKTITRRYGVASPADDVGAYIAACTALKELSREIPSPDENNWPPLIEAEEARLAYDKALKQYSNAQVRILKPLFESEGAAKIKAGLGNTMTIEEIINETAAAEALAKTATNTEYLNGLQAFNERRRKGRAREEWREAIEKMKRFATKLDAATTEYREQRAALGDAIKHHEDAGRDNLITRIIRLDP